MWSGSGVVKRGTGVQTEVGLIATGNQAVGLLGGVRLKRRLPGTVVVDTRPASQGNVAESYTCGCCSVLFFKGGPNRRCIAELRSCVKVEAAVLGSLSLISLMVSVDVKHH